jgi:hypothetical protein
MLAAEVVLDALMLVHARRGLRVHLHAANGISHPIGVLDVIMTVVHV